MHALSNQVHLLEIDLYLGILSKNLILKYYKARNDNGIYFEYQVKYYKARNGNGIYFE